MTADVVVERQATELEALCKELGIQAWARKGAPDVDFEKNDWRETKQGWTVTLQFRSVDKPQRMTVPYWQSHTAKPPSAADVLCCLCADASDYENARDFADWCSDLDGSLNKPEAIRHAQRTYDQCGLIAEKLRAFLGDVFVRVSNAEH